MKILFVAPYVPSLIRVRPYHFVRELTRQGHAVTVLAATLSAADSDTEALRPLAERVDVVRVRGSESARSCAAAVLAGHPLQSAVSISPALRARLRALLAQEPFDVVHIEHLRAAQLVRDLPAAMPRLYDAVDSISLLLERTLRSSHSLRQRAIAIAELSRTRRFEAGILAAFDETIVTSPEDAEILSRHSPAARVRVVANGVDQEYFTPLRAPREAGSVVFSGKMSYHANVTAALYLAHQVWPSVLARNPAARLTIVGSDPPQSVLDLARDQSITVTGHVPDLRPYLGHASVAVCPMIVKVGIQNKLLEAMAMGTPTVATPIAALGLHARIGRDLLVGNNPAELAAHICILLSDRTRATEIGEAGMSYVKEHHSWRGAASSLVTAYGQAILAAKLHRHRRPVA